MEKPTLLEQLKADHVNAYRLLDLLEAELDNVNQEEPADFALIRDIMQYMTHYPDLVHHPTEERLVRQLCADCSQRTQRQRHLVRQRISEDHQLLAERGREFLEAVSRVVDGGLALRADVLDAGKSYIRGQRSHMGWEEAHLFLPAAELGTSVLSELQRSLLQESDPVFGPILAAEYASLWKYIQDQS